MRCSISASRRLKEMGCNAIRTSHNPPTPELLEACDRLGMLVMDENRLLGSDPANLGRLERQSAATAIIPASSSGPWPTRKTVQTHRRRRPHRRDHAAAWSTSWTPPASAPPP